MRTPTDNPFVPGSDHVPAVWAGRTTEIADWRDVLRPRRAAGEYERGRAVLGEPGIGKSVLVARILGDTAATGGIVVPTVRIPRGSDALALLAAALEETVQREQLGEAIAARAAGLLDRISAITAVVKVDLTTARPPNPHLHVTRLLVELGRLARERSCVVVVHLDEVQNATDRDVLSQTLVAVGDALRHTDEMRDAAGNPHERVLPLLVYLTGLPEFTDRATSVAGATFARRFKPVLLKHLTDTEIRLALAPFTNGGWPILTERGPSAVVMTAEAVEALVRACSGDPFLFQLAGKAAWDASTSDVIDVEDMRAGWATVAREARSHVERSIERLPSLERALVEVLASLDPDDRTLSRAANAIGRRPTELATSARRLEDRGIIERGKPYTFAARTVEAHLRGDWP